MTSILFVRNKLPISWLIRRATGTPVSHVALRYKNWILHVNFGGMQVADLGEFRKHCEIVYEVQAPLSAELVLQKYMTYRKARYDLGALLYLGLRSLPLLGPRLPSRNIWSCTGMLMCVEWLTELLYNREDSELTPYQLYLDLTRNVKE